MKLIYNLPIQSSGLLLLTKLKKGKIHLIEALNRRIAHHITRIRQGELFALVDLYELQQSLIELETLLQEREKNYQALVRANCALVDGTNYKTLKTLACHIGTSVHSLWVSCLQLIDKVFCAIHTLQVSHTSEFRKKANMLAQSLRQDCLRYVMKLLYLPKRGPILIEAFVKLSFSEQQDMINKAKVTMSQLTKIMATDLILILCPDNAKLMQRLLGLP